MADPLWRPPSERAAAAAMTAFSARASSLAGRDLSSYFALHAWSTRQPREFWNLCADFLDLPFVERANRVMSEDAMPATRWFEGATLNYARALLYPSGLDEAQVALLALDESGGRREVSFARLRTEVGRAQEALLREGVGSGDRVAAFAANVPETVVLLLACAGIGAIFTSCSPDFGFEAAQSRFGQVQPRVLVASTVYRYGGRRFDVSDTVKRLTDSLRLDRAVALPYPGEEAPAPAGMVAWEEWLGPGRQELLLAPLPFDHPLYVLYSSGTTGLPKAIVHRAGGALLSHRKEHSLHCDIRAGDLVLYFTTCGWMMWNWLVSVLAQGAAAVLFEGSPVHPDPRALWRLAEREGISFFGTGARYLHSLQAGGIDLSQHQLRELRTIASTGSPLSPGAFEYVYRSIKEDVHLASISGGTDIVSCFMLGVPTLPVHAGQIQAPGLGVDLAAYDDDGRALEGAPGELVCRQPLPSMPLRFWNDDGGERYREAYFARFPGVWHHGDLIEITPQRGVVVYGRSDATLNPGGVRIGTAEIYRPLDGMPGLVEAAAVGKREAGDESIWLFLVLEEGRRCDAALESEIRERIRRRASPRHVPKRIIQVSELPRTRSGKAMEIAIARIVNGQDVPNLSVVANPRSLDEIARAALGTQASG